jgi:hypothetical protein
MFNNIPENRSRSPQRYQPRDPLQNDERPLPIGWERRISNNVDLGRVYYTNGRQSQWHFPNQEQNPNFVITEPEPPAYIQRAEAEYQARIELAQEEERQAQRQALIERRALLQRAEEERRALIQRAQAEERLSLREKLALITNEDFNEYNIETFFSLRRMILQDNEQPINRLNVLFYIMDLESMINILRDRNVHYDLKRLCENIFEEMFEKLANEKKLIDDGLTTHDEEDTIFLIRQLNSRLNPVYNRFMNAINNS